MIGMHCQKEEARAKEIGVKMIGGEVPAFPAQVTVLIAAFNEARVVTKLLRKVAASPECSQIVIVDDGSRDGTARLVDAWLCEVADHDVVLLRHPTNCGKGAAIRSGLAHTRGEIVLIQDADLEYDPSDYAVLVEPIQRGCADVVYGSRSDACGALAGLSLHRWCRRLLNISVMVLYGRRISDEATGYKAFRTDLLKRLDLECERFEFCPEVTAKLCRLGIPIHEVPISYHPRTAAEGKKIGWRDAAQAFWTLIWWRFAPVRLLSDEELEARSARESRERGSDLDKWASVGATPDSAETGAGGMSAPQMPHEAGDLAETAI